MKDLAILKEDGRKLLEKHVGNSMRWPDVSQLYDQVTSEDLTPNECAFHKAPASGRKAYHDCFSGGLISHSIDVTVSLLGLNKERGAEIPEASCAIVGMFHDLGKIGLPGQPYYLPQTSTWHQNKLGELWLLNRDIAMPHSMISLFWFQKYEVVLDADEFAAVAYHNGLYTDMGQELRSNEPKLMMLLHWADLWESRK